MTNFLRTTHPQALRGITKNGNQKAWSIETFAPDGSFNVLSLDNLKLIFPTVRQVIVVDSRLRWSWQRDRNAPARGRVRRVV